MKTPTLLSLLFTWLFITANAQTNTAPVANGYSYYTWANTPITMNVVINDVDAENNIDPMSVLLLTFPPANEGTLTVDPFTGEIAFTPALNFLGVTIFTYQVCDTGTPILCDNAEISITVLPLNNVPLSLDDFVTTTTNTPVIIDVIANDIDANIDPTTVSIVTPPSNHPVVVNGLTGEITFTPISDFTGMISFVYQVCDSGTPALCDQATVYVTVEAPIISPIIFPTGSGKADPTLNPNMPQIPTSPPTGNDGKAFNPFGFRITNTTTNIKLYPNPTTDRLQLQIIGQHTDNLQISLIDMAGRICFSIQQTIHKGQNQFDYTLPQLPNGNYLFQINSVAHQFNKSVLIIKN